MHVLFAYESSAPDVHVHNHEIQIRCKIVTPFNTKSKVNILAARTTVPEGERNRELVKLAMMQKGFCSVFLCWLLNYIMECTRCMIKVTALGSIYFPLTH